ncbi:GNAT family N-acetyltransferase [Polaribacter aquimarinus]|uniref:N-acetyltransferase n=1 Tax=Polaribacter aquimarinus TaxID=2100726 RepID=A0A2U2J920_9FLAO|nr:GNAT family N-acetyltransferase [Polaribacter aquimarinus]PWG04761.1 N-acetyltransferase [Polaribacter aquimarinus]
MIFETERLIVRKLSFDDLHGFYAMESNPNVLKYADGTPKDLNQCKVELGNLINRYQLENNDFCIYAIERNLDKEFIGTVALIKTNNEYEIGYRFLEKYWNKGYASEICKVLILYCKQLSIKKIVGFVVNANVASAKILEKYNFKIVDVFINDDYQQETKYELKL